MSVLVKPEIQAFHVLSARPWAWKESQQFISAPIRSGIFQQFDCVKKLGLSRGSQAASRIPGNGVGYMHGNTSMVVPGEAWAALNFPVPRELNDS